MFPNVCIYGSSQEVFIKIAVLKVFKNKREGGGEPYGHFQISETTFGLSDIEKTSL